MAYNYKFTIEYDGSRYFGWEKQPDQDTIQGKLEAVLTRYDGNPVEVIGAGRTDAGVHARAMTANARLLFETDPIELRDYMNRYLPDDISVTDVKAASERFHARFSARTKIYRYSIFDGPVKPVFDRKYYLALDEPLYDERIRQASEYLIGEHDFKSFCGNPKMKKSTIRKIFDIELKRSKGFLHITYSGSGFLQYQVRIMTGTLIEIGQGKRKPEDIIDILEAKDRTKAGPTAPAKGLCLVKVLYS